MALLIRGGHLLSMDPGVPDGVADILVVDGTIAAIGWNLAPGDAEIIDARHRMVLPGFVDTHRHSWQTAVRHIGTGWDLATYLNNALMRLAPAYTPEDVHAGTLLGALGALDAGITTLVDWSHIQNSPDHTDAAVAALAESGIRAVFAYGWPQNDPGSWYGEHAQPVPADVRRVRRDLLADDGALVTMALAVRGPELAGLDATRVDFLTARELGLRMTAHVGAGELGEQVQSVYRLYELGLLGPDLTLVHACTTSDEELKLAAAAGVTASSSPMIELTMPGLGTPAISRLREAGITTGLSSDTEISTSGDMFSQMRAAVTGHAVKAADVLRMATLDGAATAGLAGRTGSLTPGRRADLIVLDATAPALAPVSDRAAAIVFGGHPGMVETVIVNGVVVKRHGRLVGRIQQAQQAARESLERLRRTVPDLFAQ